MDIERHIGMIKSFRSTAAKYDGYVPYMMPNDIYYTHNDRWVDMPVEELLLVEISKNDLGQTAECITTITKTSSTTIEIAIYANYRGWNKIASCTAVRGSNDNSLGTHNSYNDFWVSPFYWATNEFIRFEVGVKFGQLQFLSEPTIYADYIEPDPYAQQARQKRGKKLLPAYRVIRPGQTVRRYPSTPKPAPDTEGKHGSPKSPHWNRGCTYVRKNGRVVHKRPYSVKGGKCDLPILVLKPNDVSFA